ncbi:MAG: endo-beta-N-acetylglucosaminidase [Bacteroidaceae bacterium]|nr:endo-beta-N-acetylglucosaminidase [Bacteroidaceae bacterium]
MKKRYFAGLALALTLFVSPVSAQNEEIYDFSGFDTKAMLDLFYDVHQDGRVYPTMEEFATIGIQASDIAFVRSHVRRANIMSRADRLVPQTYETRNLWTNIPMDVGSDGLGGYPNDKFAADVFSMWQYVNLFGSWNHSFFQAPGAWVDAAHRNGSDIFSGIAFFESWTGDGDKTYSAMITQKDANNQFIYVKPLIHCLMYFGADGINYNWEDNSYSNADIVAFHKELWKYAAECGYDNYHSGIYTSASGFNVGNADALFGTKATGKTHDTMLNYANGDFSYMIGSTVAAAEQAYGTADGVYTGVWIVGMDRRWTALDENDNAHKAGICLWGEHGQSRFMSYNSGDDAYDTQGNYQRLLERAFSGGYRNPAERPAVSNTGNNWEKDGDKLPLSTFAGMATWIPERSAIQGGLHFRTHFTLGNGDRYYYKGKMAHSSSWYNMGAQDLVPTYRWLRYKSNTTDISNAIEVNYTHLDAYTGGSCIELTGASTAEGTDIVLFKTNLKANADAYAKLAVKTLNDTKATDLYLIVKKAGNDAWLEYPYGDVAGNNWEEKKFDLAGIAAGDVVERIGLRVKGNNANYQLYVGKLELNDNSPAVAPAEVKDVVAEVKKETKGSMTIKLHWDVDAQAVTRANWGLVYNDEANIDHFEILYKNGEDGKVAQVGTTSQWATLIPNVRFESANDAPYVGVRAVSTDLKAYSPIAWVEIPRGVQAELPDEVVEDTYGVSAMDPACEGADIARRERYVEWITTTGATQNLDYKANGPVADGSQYANCLDQVLKVNQGQEISMTIKAANYGDGLQYCFAGGWMDLNASGNFDDPLPMPGTLGSDGETTSPTGERLFKAGKIRAASPEFQTTGLTFTFKVPEDATPGDSRLRIVFSDAWFAGMFLPTGLHAKGFSMDFSVEILGDNPGRVAADTRDQGVAEEPENLNAETSVENIVAGAVSVAEGAEGAILFNNVEKAWVYTADGKFVKYANNNPAAVAVEAGVYLVKMQNGNVMRSAKVLVK